MIEPAVCPVLKLQNQVQGLACDLAKALRRLRKAQALCETCPKVENCQTHRELNAVVMNALQAAWDEWGNAQ